MQKLGDEKKKRRSKKVKKKKSKKKKAKKGVSLVEQRIAEAQEKNEQREREEKQKIFEAWTHGFDEGGHLMFKNPVLRKNQYEVPEGYVVGVLPSPSEHVWEDVFKKIDRKGEGAITTDLIEASIKIEPGLKEMKSISRKRLAEKIVNIFSRTPNRTGVITLEDWNEMRKRLPEFSKVHIKRLIAQFGLKKKAYYKLEDVEEEVEDTSAASLRGFASKEETIVDAESYAIEAETTTAVASSSAAASVEGRWVELFDDASGSPYYYNEATGETSWDPPPTSAEQQYVY